MRGFKRLCAVFIGLSVAYVWSPAASALELNFYKIASGSRGGVYFPVASAIAKSISNPPG